MAGAPLEVANPLAEARQALAGAEWRRAADLFEQLATDDDSAVAWEGLSWASWWLGDEQATLHARELAYRRHQAENDLARAAHMAVWLAGDHLDFRGDDAVARAWLRRAGSLLEGLPTCAEHGWLLVMDADLVVNSEEDPAVAVELAREAVAVAREVGDAGVEVVATAVLGTALVGTGAVTEGLRCVEQSTAMAVGAEFSQPAAPGWALCHNAAICAEVGDLGQADQWCRELHRFASTWRARHFFGICRLAYGGVLTTRGDWTSAEDELVSAREDLRSTKPGLAGPSAVRLGELRVRQGRLEEARTLFEEALPSAAAVVALGGLDLLGGDPEAAAEAAERALRRLPPGNVLERLPALELLARGRAALGDHDRARAACNEAVATTEQLGTPYLLGRGLALHADVALAADDPDGARRAAEDACDLFSTASAPFDRAHARLTLSRALHRLGREARAETEQQAARAALAELGVRADPRVSAEGLSTRELDVLRLVAEGLSDGRIAESLFLSPHTVHRHVANVRTKLGVASRAAAVADATRRGLL